MLEHYNFRDGKIIFNYFHRLGDGDNLSGFEQYLTEDMLSVSFFDEKYIIDVGYYDKNGAGVFISRLISNNDWDDPQLEKETDLARNIPIIIEELINVIYSKK